MHGLKCKQPNNQIKWSSGSSWTSWFWTLAKFRFSFFTVLISNPNNLAKLTQCLGKRTFCSANFVQLHKICCQMMEYFKNKTCELKFVWHSQSQYMYLVVPWIKYMVIYWSPHFSLSLERWLSTIEMVKSHSCVYYESLNLVEKNFINIIHH